MRDIGTLNDQKEEMLRLAGKILSWKRKGADSSSTAWIDSKLSDEIQEIGAVGNISKASAGKEYLPELSSQIGHFLLDKLADNYGVMSLPEAYRLFNRARFAHPISPTDFIDAVSMWQKLRLPLQLHSYPTGVKIILLTGELIKEITNKIISLVVCITDEDEDGKQYVGVSRTSIARNLSIPVTVVGYYLEEAESQGIICRDEGPEGLLFFKNEFSNFIP